MSSNMPQDELLQRYEKAKAVLSDGLATEPSDALRQRILQAARDQADAINSVALHADSMPASGLKSIQNPLENKIAKQEAANDSFWNIRALGTLAVMGLAGLLYWQFEHGTPEEKLAAKSAQPSSVAVITAPAQAQAQAPAAAPIAAYEATPAIAPAPAVIAKSEAAMQANAKKQSSASLEPRDVIAEQSTAPSARKDAPPSDRASIQEAAPVTAPSPNPSPTSAAAQAPPAPVAPRPAPAAAPMARAMPPSEKAIADAAVAASSPSYAGPASAPSAAPVAPAPRAAARTFIASPEKLFQTIEAKNAPALRQALAEGASQNARTSEGSPALHQAVVQRWAEGVRLLLIAGADRNAKNSKGHTAADVALELGYADMTELLAMPR